MTPTAVDAAWPRLARVMVNGSRTWYQDGRPQRKLPFAVAVALAWAGRAGLEASLPVPVSPAPPELFLGVVSGIHGPPRKTTAVILKTCAAANDSTFNE
jgi:hypothetical protein